MHDVVLVYPPIADVATPAIGLSNFKTLLEVKNISCKIIYANIIYRDIISDETYSRLNNLDTQEVIYHFADFIFASKAFPTAQNKHYSLENQYFQLKNDEFSIETLLQLKHDADNFLQKILEIVIKEKPKIVGFNSTYHQTCAAVAIANEIKKYDKNIITVLGGFNCNQPMDNVLKDLTPNIDYIFSGEAEISFIDFTLNALNKIFPKQKVVKCSPIDNLDSLPYPDYTDYFEFLNKSDYNPADIKETVRLVFESSRGCWWSKCTFCGQNCNDNVFREKSPKRIREELSFLVNFYKQKIIFAVDTALPKNSAKNTFRSFNKPKQLEHIIYQLRTNILFDELAILKDHGFKICHPGIETLNDHILNLMNKGSNTLNNIRVLRDCKTLNLFNFWNFLYGIPGESVSDYESIIKLIPILHHLRPPSSDHKVNIVRYSPLFNFPEKYGISNLRPKGFSDLIYPDHKDIVNLNLYFEGDYLLAFDNKSLRERFFSSLNKWRMLWNDIPPELDLYHLEDNKSIIKDTRDPENKRNYEITSKHLSILKKLKEPDNYEALYNYIETNNLQNEFDNLIEWSCILEISGNFLSLVVNCN